MATKNNFQKLIADAKLSDSYWSEKAKLDFAVTLERHRRATGLSYKELAEKLGTSQAYISKVFRGDSNLTIETMVKLARKIGGHLEVKISTPSVSPDVWSQNKGQSRLTLVSSNTVTTHRPSDGQSDLRSWAREAA